MDFSRLRKKLNVVQLFPYLKLCDRETPYCRFDEKLNVFTFLAKSH